MKKLKEYFWHIGRNEYLTWDEYNRSRAIPSWMRKKYLSTDILRKRIRKISVCKVIRGTRYYH